MNTSTLCDVMLSCLVTPVRSLLNSFRHVGVPQLPDVVEEAGLTARLREPGPFTVFAPQRRAITNLSRNARYVVCASALSHGQPVAQCQVSSWHPHVHARHFR